MFFNLSLGRVYGIDSLIEVFSILVTVMISLYSYKIYKAIKEDKYKFFSVAFLLISISFLFKVISNFTVLKRITIEKVNFIYVILVQSDYTPIIDFFAFTLYKTFYFIGFLILFLLLEEVNKKEKIFLLIYFSIIAVLFSIYFNFLFHINVFVILLFLTIHFYHNYKNKRIINSLLVYLGFILMTIGHSFFIFSNKKLFYIIGEIGLLLGFSCLLINQLKIFFDSKFNNEKNKIRGNKRYTRGIAKK